jgi:fluoroacetyl-CoA thioesterase
VKDTLKPGLELEMTYEVTADMAPPHLPVKVLSTPSMIGLMEGTCLQCVQPHLDDNETTVGTHVNVSHTGPARVGEEVRVTGRLREITKRRLLFDVKVTAPQGDISTGTHERAVVDLSRMSGG